jgi:hypothetical protein
MSTFSYVIVFDESQKCLFAVEQGSNAEVGFVISSLKHVKFCIGTKLKFYALLSCM